MHFCNSNFLHLEVSLPNFEHPTYGNLTLQAINKDVKNVPKKKKKIVSSYDSHPCFMNLVHVSL
jgi:hypothetical protein